MKIKLLLCSLLILPLIGILFSTNVSASSTEFKTSNTVPLGDWTQDSMTSYMRSHNADFDMLYNNYSYVIYTEGDYLYMALGKGVGNDNRSPIIFGRDSSGLARLLFTGVDNLSFCLYQFYADNTVSSCNNPGNFVLYGGDTSPYTIYRVSNEKYAPDGGMTESWFYPWVSDPIIITPPAINLSYQVNITVEGSYTNFRAKYKNKTTDPVSSLPDPDNISWAVMDNDEIDTNSPTGKKLVCDIVSLPRASIYDYSNCNLSTLNKDHSYSIVAGFVIGNGTQDGYVNGGNTYNITYKMASYEIPIDNPNYNLDSTTCTVGQINGELGFGQNCSIPPKNYYQCSISNLLDPVEYTAFFLCVSQSTVDLISDTLSFLFIPDPQDIAEHLKSFNTQSSGVTAIISAPISIINTMVFSQCSAINLPLPFVNKSMDLPCMTPIYQQRFGVFFTMYQLIASGVISYWLLVRYLTRYKHLYNPKDNKIDVVDL